MLNIFKSSKPKLCDMIPKNFKDIHTHILPGIDDGAKTVDESLELISELNKIGITKIIGTPHTYPGLYENTSETIKKSYVNLKKSLPKNISVSYASEYIIDNSLIFLAQNKSLLPVFKNYVLIEMNFISEPINLFEIIFELQINGYCPIIAHPERYLFYNQNISKFSRLKEIGCLFQINLLSTIGYYGREVQLLCDKLLKMNLIDYAASDIHNINQIKYFEKNLKIREISKLEKVLNQDF